MQGIKGDLNYSWNGPNRTLVRLILINVGVFLLLNLIKMTADFGESSFYLLMTKIFFIPAAIQDFMARPWSLFTYFFSHEDLWHILPNMLMMFWFGMMVKQNFRNGNRQVLVLYIFGGIAGGVLYLFMYNMFDFYKNISPVYGMIGASASVYAMVTSVAVLVPDLRMNLLFLGPVKLKYIALTMVILSFFGVGGSNAGGNLAHMGGVALGFVHARQYAAGKDWSIFWAKILKKITGLFKRKPKIRVSHRRAPGQKGSKPGQHSDKDKQPSQDRIDAILDKITENGYENLSSEEKQILFDAGRK